MQKFKVYTASIVFIFILSVVIFQIQEHHSRSQLYKYLPKLKNYDLYDIKFRKMYPDPNYKIPYNLLVTFKSGNKNIIKELGLENIQKIDTNLLKKSTWMQEYRLYFTMQSLNGTRYKTLEDETKSIKWWKVRDCNNNYAAPYIDKDNIRQIVKFGELHNGRIVCCQRGKLYYLLIECWG